MRWSIRLITQESSFPLHWRVQRRCEQHRRTQVYGDMSIEQGRIGRRRRVVLEDGGVVHEETQRTVLAGLCDKVGATRRISEVGGQSDGGVPRCRERLRLRARAR